MTKRGRIRAGIGGWTYKPWRTTFYPKDLAQARELEYASRQLTTIEINGTYYRLQSASSFAKWRDVTPDGFVFSVKATRSASAVKTGYKPAALAAWAKRACMWANGDELGDLPRIGASTKSGARRDVYIYFINGAKERALAAATALLVRL